MKYNYICQLGITAVKFFSVYVQASLNKTTCYIYKYQYNSIIYSHIFSDTHLLYICIHM